MVAMSDWLSLSPWCAVGVVLLVCWLVVRRLQDNVEHERWMVEDMGREFRKMEQHYQAELKKVEGRADRAEKQAVVFECLADYVASVSSAAVAVWNLAVYKESDPPARKDVRGDIDAIDAAEDALKWARKLANEWLQKRDAMGQPLCKEGE